MTSISYYDSPLGKLLIKAENDALKGIWFSGQQHFPNELMLAMATNENTVIITQAHQWLDDYFSGNRPDISRLRLAPESSAFRRDVWNILVHIPYGCSLSYGQIARELERKYGRRMSAQAVGSAVGHNPISIVIPCHRVLGAGGKLGGYAGGIERKTALLLHEGIAFTI